MLGRDRALSWVFVSQRPALLRSGSRADAATLRPRVLSNDLFVPNALSAA